ncbi:hypothetical protein IWQ57_006880, partial [Coemansia nantahalensis]
PRPRRPAVLRPAGVALHLLPGHVPHHQPPRPSGHWHRPDRCLRLPEPELVAAAPQFFQRQRWHSAARRLCVQPGLCRVAAPPRGLAPPVPRPEPAQRV